jgi:hypothetical protein
VWRKVYIAETVAAGVRGQAVVFTTNDNDDPASQLSPPPLLLVSLDVHFTVMSLLATSIKLVCLLTYLLVACLAKLTVSITLFPMTALTVAMTATFTILLCQDAEIAENNAGDPSEFFDCD